MPTRTFILNGEVLSRDEAPGYFRHGEYGFGWSMAYLCPQCGEIWARIFIDGAPWYAMSVPCTNHDHSPTLDAGTFYQLGDDASYRAAPHEVLLHDFKQRLKDKSCQSSQ